MIKEIIFVNLNFKQSLPLRLKKGGAGECEGVDYCSGTPLGSTSGSTVRSPCRSLKEPKPLNWALTAKAPSLCFTQQFCWPLWSLEKSSNRFFFFSQKLSMGGFSGALNSALWLVCGAQEGTMNPWAAQPWAGRQLQEDRSQGFRNLFKRNLFWKEAARRAHTQKRSNASGEEGIRTLETNWKYTQNVKKRIGHGA